MTEGAVPSIEVSVPDLIPDTRVRAGLVTYSSLRASATWWLVPPTSTASSVAWITVGLNGCDGLPSNHINHEVCWFWRYTLGVQPGITC